MHPLVQLITVKDHMLGLGAPGHHALGPEVKAFDVEFEGIDKSFVDGALVCHPATTEDGHTCKEHKEAELVVAGGEKCNQGWDCCCNVFHHEFFVCILGPK